MSKKMKILILWVAFALCLVITIALWFAMNNTKLEFEEVEVVVESAKTEQIRNRKTGGTTTFYKIKVRYQGERYDLENAHNVYMYPEGKSVKAYLSNGRLFANEEGVKTSTPVSIVYYVFLFGTFAMLFVAPTYTAKLKKEGIEE